MLNVRSRASLQRATFRGVDGVNSGVLGAHEQGFEVAWDRPGWLRIHGDAWTILFRRIGW